MRRAPLSVTAALAIVALAACASDQKNPETVQPPAARPSSVTPSEQPMAATPQQPLAQEPLDTQREQPPCPMIDALVNVRSEETDNGVALIFTTEGDRDRLVEQVRHIATVVNTSPPPRMGQGMMRGQGQGMMRGQRRGQGMMRRQGQGMMRGQGQGMMRGQRRGQGMMRRQQMGLMHGWRMMDAAANVEEIDAGARLLLNPRDPSRVDQLRDQARQHASQMSMTCPMMRSEQRPS